MGAANRVGSRLCFRTNAPNYSIKPFTTHPLMFTPEEYSLLDFGGGRKLERFGAYILDRPCVEAESDALSEYELWSESNAQFVCSAADRGAWSPSHALPTNWTIEHRTSGMFDSMSETTLRFELKLTNFGHVGIFPEQAANWDWLAARLGNHRCKVLNLFAYTGGSTLTAAAAGAEVVHVDSAQNTVAWARRNAELSGLSDAPIHWIVEDVRRFVSREEKRGNRYDGIILDPPSFGHGPKREVWKLSEHLDPLLRSCAKLLRGAPRPFVLLTCHTDRVEVGQLRGRLAEAVSKLPRGEMVAEQLTLETNAGRRLPSGIVARWSGV